MDPTWKLRITGTITILAAIVFVVCKVTGVDVPTITSITEAVGLLGIGATAIMARHQKVTSEDAGAR